MKISLQDLAFLNRQLASMVNLKMPLAEGFAVLAKECRGENFRALLEEIHNSLKNGKKLSQALAEKPEIFPAPYVALIEAGETSGDLASALESLADYSETSMEFKNSLVNIAFIPVITALTAVGISAFIFTSIFPKFKEIFASLDVELPWLTGFALSLSEFFMQYGQALLLGLLGVLFIMVISFVRRAMWLDCVLLNLPFMGEALRTVHYTRFCQTLCHLLKQRIPLNTALALTKNIFRSPVFHAAVEDMKKAVENGESMTEQARAAGIFPETMLWKLSFAEKKGDMVQTLQELQRYLLGYYRMLTSRLIYLLAPCLVIVIALFVGSLVLSVFLPIFKLQANL